MPELTPPQKSRLETLQLVGTDPQKVIVKALYEEASGDWTAFAAKVTAHADLGAAFLDQLKWPNLLGDWSAVTSEAGEIEKDDTALVKKLLADGDVKTLRDIALKYGLAQLEQLAKSVMDGATDEEVKKRALTLLERLYRTYKKDMYVPVPTAVLTRLIEDKNFKMTDAVRAELLKFLKATPEFAFEKISGDDLKPDSDILKTIDEKLRPKVIVELKEIDALERLSPTVVLVLKLHNDSYYIHVRIKTLGLVLTTEQQKQVPISFAKLGPDTDAVVNDIKNELGEPVGAKVAWANQLGNWSRTIDANTSKATDDTTLVDLVLKENIGSWRALGLAKGLDALAQLVHQAGTVRTDATADPTSLPQGGVPLEAKAWAKVLRTRLYDNDRSVVITRMIQDSEITVSSDVRDNVVSLLRSKLEDTSAVPEFDLKALLEVREDAGLLASVTGDRPAIAKELRKLALMANISPTPDTVVALYDANLTAIATITEPADPPGYEERLKQFVDRFGFRIGDEVAKRTYEAVEKLRILRRASEPEIASRITTMSESLTAIGGTTSQAEKLTLALAKAGGDWAEAKKELTDLKPEEIARLDLARELGAWSEDRSKLVSEIVTKKGEGGTPLFLTIADVARRVSRTDIATMLGDGDVRTLADGDPTRAAVSKQVLAANLRENLFREQPLPVLEKVVASGEFSITKETVKRDVLTFISNVEKINADPEKPTYEVHRDPVFKAFELDGAFEGVANRDEVKAEFSTLTRLSVGGGVSNVVVKEDGLTSNFAVSEIPQSVYVERYKEKLGSEEAASTAHTNAMNTRIRNENRLIALREVVRGTGFRLLDQDYESQREDSRQGDNDEWDRAKRIESLARTVNDEIRRLKLDPRILNLSSLFGDVDTCECGHCHSVYSPTAYYVDLLNFLRNNNFDRPTPGPGIEGTPLENLFRRRPDLGHLKLTCENTLTVLPYIDLANEVMESFIVHLDQYRRSSPDRKLRQANLDVHDVDDETSGELLAQPRYVNYKAYCRLSETVYPTQLPYHQPVDSIRISLREMKTSRHELIDKFRRPASNCFPADHERYVGLHDRRSQRGYVAEFLGMTEDEYKIITKEAFWEKGYFEIRDKKGDQYPNYSDPQYRVLIGVLPTEKYCGFESANEMLASLPIVKHFLLPRLGVSYAELVELLKTEFLNPQFPQGKALNIFMSLPASYRYLRSLVIEDAEDPEDKFRKLMEYLVANMPGQKCGGQAFEDVKRWVYCHFIDVGQLVVLNSLNSFPAGRIFKNDGTTLVAELNEDGVIRKDYVPVGTVLISGDVVDLNGKPFATERLRLHNYDGKHVGYISQDGLFLIVNGEPKPWKWSPFDPCNIDTVRLERLDGREPVGDVFYDRLHRFVRLWRKLSWTIDEVDKAVVAFYSSSQHSDCEYPGKSEGKPASCSPKKACDSNSVRIAEITPESLAQLVTFRKIIERTGLEIRKQLTFWKQISTAGEKSLYVSLFLTHNLQAIDDVFKPDATGAYLAQAAKISEHIPVLMAALMLKEPEILAIDRYCELNDRLDLASVTVLYRHALLARFLGVRPPDLEAVASVFGPLFESPQKTWDFLELWKRMDDAGLSFANFRYIVKGVDDAFRPSGITKIGMLRFKKAIYDALTRIDAEHADLGSEPDPSSYSTGVVRTKAALLLEQSLVDGILGLIEGTTVYAANTNSGYKFTIPDFLPSAKTLRRKLKYTDVDGEAVVEITGILTGQEVSDALTLVPGDAEWKDAIERAGLQAVQFFDLNIADLFGVTESGSQCKSETKSAKAASASRELRCLLAGDEGEATTASKAIAFLTHYLPYLRKTLSRQAIVSKVAETFSTSAAEAECLIAEIVVDNSLASQPAIKTIEAMKLPATGGTWSGFLLPSGAGSYRFYATGETQPASLSLQEYPNGVFQQIAFSHQLPDLRLQKHDKDQLWYTDPVELKSQLYALVVQGKTPQDIQWKLGTATRSPIPASATFPEASSSEEVVLKKLDRASKLVVAYMLKAPEIRFWHNYRNSAGTRLYDFNDVSFSLWQRIQRYAQLRSDRPFTLIDLFIWADKPNDRWSQNDLTPDAKKALPVGEVVAAKISKATGWDEAMITQLLSPAQFDLKDPRYFRNEKRLHKLKDALLLQARLGVETARLFLWGEPTSEFDTCRKIAADIRSAFRARYNQENWEVAVKPLNDELRSNQQKALVAHLLVQDVIREWGVTDANSLFEFLLIDVQMEPCMKTSRIKQAISSVQLFIHRVLIGLEKKYGLAPNAVDRKRWEWMQKYRVWEANRKVFLYPENWIRPELRDDKSEPFSAFESECIQQDFTRVAYETNLRTLVRSSSDVANLRVIGLFAENPIIDGDQTRFDRLFIIARTRNEPFRYFYRTFQDREANNTVSRLWTPWQTLDCDVPTIRSGNYTDGFVIPVVWRGRPFLFTPRVEREPQNSRMTVLTNHFRFDKSIDINKKSPWIFLSAEEIPPTDVDKGSAPGQKDQQSARLKIGMSGFALGDKNWELVGGASQEMHDAIELPREPFVTLTFASDIVENVSVKGKKWPHHEDGNIGVARLGYYLYCQEARDVPPLRFPVSEDSSGVSIAVFDGSERLGGFSYNGDYIEHGGAFIQAPARSTYFHYAWDKIYSMQTSLRFAQAPVTADRSNFTSRISLTSSQDQQRLGNPLAQTLVTVSRRQELNELFSVYDRLSPTESSNAFGKVNGAFHELTLPNAIYNWELAFHAPLMASDLFLKSQQFDQAIEAIHAVFDPQTDSPAPRSYWRFRPFRETDSLSSVRSFFNSLEPGKPDPEITDWRDNPFQPHRIARNRGPMTYMKFTVMKYIEALIANGDYYFRQNTLETLPIAIQYYVTASNIFGPRGQHIPKRGRIRPESFMSLLGQWDAFSNALANMELFFPNGHQGHALQESAEDKRTQPDVPTANVLGFASTLYFCIPDNPRIKELRDTIDDRLFKIRHCQDIDGIYRELPLFEPPIDPALLVQAAAQGLSLSSVLNDLNSPMPNYRFEYLMQKALELCNEVKSLGANYLASREKEDAEALSAIRSSHDSAIQQLVLSVREQQLEEAKRSLDALRQSRKGPEYRLRYFLQLIGENLSVVPDFESDFRELQGLIGSPVDESTLKLSQYEKQELDKAKESSDKQVLIGRIEQDASQKHALPTITANIQFWGLGVSISYGGSNLGAALQAVARGQRIDADQVAFESSRASRLGNFERLLQERIQQANAAGYEIKNIDKQILAAQVRVNIAEREIAVQQKQIENAKQIEDFLSTKYTHKQLYTYMKGELRNLHYSAYQLAYEMARKVEKVFRFERGLTTTNFIEPGYWVPGRDGFFAGEKLYQALKRLELAYHEERGHAFEVTKDVSLRQVNPLALAALRETGACEFEIPELVFDLDFPGQYKRRIKSVAISIPAVVGPHSSLSCTARLLEHRYRHSPKVSNKSDYPQKLDEDDLRFATTNVPITAIAVGQGQQDSGVFELNFRDERFMPFEGAGAISKWRLQLPKLVRQFDYGTISDVIVHIRYTADDGGDKLRDIVEKYLEEDVLPKPEQLGREQGLFAIFDLKHEFSAVWHQFASPSGSSIRELKIGNIINRLPHLAAWRGDTKVKAQDIHFVSADNFLATLSPKFGDDSLIQSDIAGIKCMSAGNGPLPLGDWILKANRTTQELSPILMIVRLQILK